MTHHAGTCAVCCGECGEKRKLRYLHPETGQRICANCRSKATLKSAICPVCKRERLLRSLHPETGQRICRRCHSKATFKFATCPVCKKGPKLLHFLHPETGQRICANCHLKATLKFAICPVCKREKLLRSPHPETGERICPWCAEKFRKERLRQWFLGLSLEQSAKWILDTAVACIQKESKERGEVHKKALREINELAKREPEGVKKILREIQTPPYPSAARIIQLFIETEEGKKLRGLL